MAYRVGNKKRGDKGIYIGRPSVLGNPFSRDDREINIENFRKWLWERLQADSPQLREIALLAEQKDGMLICWCKPLDCHGDVIVRAIEWYRGLSKESKSIRKKK